MRTISLQPVRTNPAYGTQMWFLLLETKGLEQHQDSSEKTTVSEQGGAESGAQAASTAVSDPDLAAVVKAWPKLPEPVRAGIVAMVKAARR